MSNQQAKLDLNGLINVIYFAQMELNVQIFQVGAMVGIIFQLELTNPNVLEIRTQWACVTGLV